MIDESATALEIGALGSADAPSRLFELRREVRERQVASLA